VLRVAGAIAVENVAVTAVVNAASFDPGTGVRAVIVGATVSTAKLRASGVASTPTPLTARTWKLCAPCARPEYVFGVAQPEKSALSRLHSNVALRSSDANVKVTVDVFTVPLGPPVMVVVGGEPPATLTVHVRAGGAASALPAGSTARTPNVCVPFASPLRVAGDVQAAKDPPSRRHWNVAVVSGEWNVNVALAEPTVPLGPVSITVDGATVSTVKLRVAGVASALPTTSRARTWNACWPSLSVEYVAGDAHVAKVTPSSEHWNVAAPSGEVNENVALVAGVGPLGPAVIVVSGAVVSTVQVREAGVGSGPAAFVARTRSVCAPSASTA
jgi:hypothetical protein